MTTWLRRQALVIALAGATAGLLPATIATASVREPQAAAASGPLLATGNDQFGQLGDGSTTYEYTPVEVNPPAGLRVVAARVTTFGVAVTAGGQVWTWGRNDEGELGDGTTADSGTPVAVKLPAGTKIRSARAGFHFAVAVTTTGKVLTWGDNTAGELGIGTKKQHDRPVRVQLPAGVRVTAVTAGADFALALTSAGQLYAWGDNSAGALGNGRATGSLTPVRVRLPRGVTVSAVSGAVSWAIAVTSAGRLLNWGSNSARTEGNVAVRRKPYFVRLPKGVKVTQAYGGLQHEIALTRGGRVLSWGSNSAGQLGVGTGPASSATARWVKLPAGARVRSIAAGRYFSLALTTSGKVWGWGDNSDGALGIGLDSSIQYVPVTMQVPGVPIAIGAGNEAYSSMIIVRKIID